MRAPDEGNDQEAQSGVGREQAAISNESPLPQQPQAGRASRRALLMAGAAGAGGAGFALAGMLPGAGAAERPRGGAPSPSASASASALPALLPMNRFPRMVQEYFVQQVRQAEALAELRRVALNDAASAEAYVREVRTQLQKIFGPWPQRTPLNARVTGALDRDDYRVEKVIFESRPKFPVTANLYIPKRRKFPLPGVVGACGHAGTGKASMSYQSFAQSLARLGYVVLIYDPISQAERVQLLTPEKEPISGRNGITEHTRFGMHLSLLGDSMAAWSAWDGIRALDYLLTRREVDPHHVGVTGNSGGGTQATWLAANDRRVTMAAPSCFVTTFRRNLENELLSDAEQCPPHVLAEGLDQGDLLAAMAPKPLLLLGRAADFFDVRGLEESYQRLRRLYRLLGKEDQVGLYVGPGSHRFGVDSREAMYGWFNRCTKVSEVSKEPSVHLEDEKDLWCTPNGRVADLNPRNIVSLLQQRATELNTARREVKGEALEQAIVEVLKLRSRKRSPDYRVLQPLRARGYPLPQSITYLIETEPGVQAVVYSVSKHSTLGRPHGSPRAILYIAHQSSDAELRQDPLLAETVATAKDLSVYTCDVRGIGESWPNTGVAGSGGVEYFYSVHGMMLDLPYVGLRTHDVLTVIDWMEAAGHREIHLVGNGWGAIPACFAAVLSGLVTQVTLKNSLTSYSDIATSTGGLWPASVLPWGVLQRFDLPDCYRELQEKKGLRQVSPLIPKRQPPSVKWS